MTRALLLSLALGLAACAAQPSDQPSTDLWIPVALSCNADAAEQCPSGGCGAAAPSMWQAPMSLYLPAQGSTGRLCIATGCEDATIAPTLTRALGYTAVVAADDRTHTRADLEVARDLQSFRMRQHAEGTVTTWNGVCSPAGS